MLLFGLFLIYNFFGFVGWTTSLIILLALALYFILNCAEPLPLSGIYSQGGKFRFLKYWLIRIAYRYRKSKKIEDTKSAGYGVKAIADIATLDTAQPLPPDAPEAVDAVYFNGCNRDGYYIVVSAARRPNNIIQSMLMIRLPHQNGVLELAIAPHTTLAADGEGYCGGGIVITPVEPMKQWTILFNGLMKLSSDCNRRFKVRLSCHWINCTGHFDFDSDMHEHVIAEAISREVWTREWFQRLKSFHQTHYEQFGDIETSLHIQEIDEQDNPIDQTTKTFHLNLRGVRDHSFGRIRDWAHIYRYVLHYFHLEDGTCINLSCVCMPGVSLSQIDLGFVYEPSGRKLVLLQSFFPMSVLGNDGTTPNVFNFSFKAVDPSDTGYVQSYDIECEVIERNNAYFGDKWEAKVCEQMCRCQVNGKIKGVGFAEWEFRNLCGKPV